MRTSLVVVVSAAVFLVQGALLAGCPRPLPPVEEPPAENPGVPGTLGGRCATGGFCNGDLVCEDDVCVDDGSGPAEGEGEATGEGEGEAGGEGEGEGEAGGEGEGEGEGPPCVDRDGDGSCVEDDCDDDDADRAPERDERCSFVDENCDGEMNGGIDCTFIAHTRDTLYKIDPFAETATEFRSVILGTNPSILDIDSNNDGTLLAATRDGIFQIRTDGSLASVANVPAPVGTNGICITGNDTIFLTNDDRDAPEASAAWKVENGLIIQVGTFSGGLVSSGDCVVTKEEDVLMSAKDPDNVAATDLLVLINSGTGATTTVGNIGFSKVFGLSSSFGLLYGVTSTGEVIQINRNSGIGTLLFTALDGGTAIQFFGAANGD